MKISLGYVNCKGQQMRKVHLDKPVVDQIKHLGKILRDKQRFENDLTNELQEQFPELESISMSTHSLTVYTKMHSVYFGSYKPFNSQLSMICDKKSMPDTVDEFLQAKEMMKKDAEACLRIGYYLVFRFKEGVEV